MRSSRWESTRKPPTSDATRCTARSSDAGNGKITVVACPTPIKRERGNYDFLGVRVENADRGGIAVDTDQALIDRVIAEKMMVCGSHFPFPGAGTFLRDGGGYAFAPTAAA